MRLPVCPRFTDPFCQCRRVGEHAAPLSKKLQARHSTTPFEPPNPNSNAQNLTQNNCPRWRVRDNLPGNRDYCPIVRRTAAIQAAETYDLPAKLAELEADFGVDLILRRTNQTALNLATLQRRSDQAMRHRLEKYHNRAQELARLMETLSHTSVLKRGFAIVLNDQGLPVKAAVAVQSGENLTLRFNDGDVSAIATGENLQAPAVKKKNKPSNPKTDNQGTLF